MARRTGSTTAPVAVQQPAAPTSVPLPQTMTDADKFAILSTKSFGALTREERKFVEEFSRKTDKAQDGAYAHIGFGEGEDAGKLQLDIRMINLTQPGMKRTEDGRPYLFSLDGFELVAYGKTWTVGTFYAVEKKAKK